ncbi:MAG: MotA/TolQ/ExbB proton channel family protein [Ignavibacteria bacterium]|jgi:chemotaxis protein MotA
MNKKQGSFYGLLLGIVSIFGSFFLEGGSFKALFLIPPIIIVFGGTFAATIIGFGYERFKQIYSLTKLAYVPRSFDIRNLIERIVEISMKVRKEGLLSVEKDLEKLEFGFPQKMIKFVLDGTNAEMLETVAFTEIKAMEQRHNSNISIFLKMGGYAPTMGIIGTVMALIMTLANAGEDPTLLIHSIASAFIATLWGIVSANLIWLPIADKLKQCHLEEKHMMQVSLEGVLAIQSGEIPTLVRARMMSMLPAKDQEN